MKRTKSDETDIKQKTKHVHNQTNQTNQIKNQRNIYDAPNTIFRIFLTNIITPHISLHRLFTLSMYHFQRSKIVHFGIIWCHLESFGVVNVTVYPHSPELALRVKCGL